MPRGFSPGRRPSLPASIQRDAAAFADSIEAGEERLALDGVAKMLNDLTPRDRVGVITFPQGEIVSDLTTNHERTRTALAGVTGHKPRSNEVDPTLRNVVGDLGAIIDGFGRIEGPKTVILITSSMPAITTYGDGSTADQYADLLKAASRVSADATDRSVSSSNSPPNRILL